MIIPIEVRLCEKRTMNDKADIGETVKKQIAEQLSQFLLVKNKTPDSVSITVRYPESIAMINISINCESEV